jgi:hypothetical protein
MTTIAWDGRFLAADTLACSGGYRIPKHADKLALGDGWAYGCCGRLVLLQAWVDWHREGARYHHAPARTDGQDAFVAVQRRSSGHPPYVEFFTGDMPYPSPVAAPDAWGTGSTYAIGAMLFGAAAPAAVAVAIQADPNSGGVVRYIDTQRDEWIIEEWNPEHFLTLRPEMRPGWNWPFMLDAGEREMLRAHDDAVDAFARGTGMVLPKREGELDPNVALELPPSIITGPMHLVVPKPGPGPQGWAAEECKGLLADGTGCGQCKRCNREWHVLRRHAEPVTDVNGAITSLRVTEAAKATVAQDSPSTSLEDWVERWNTASLQRDGLRLTKLNAELRGMVLDPGVQIVEEYDDLRRVRQKRLVRAADAAPPSVG